MSLITVIPAIASIAGKILGKKSGTTIGGFDVEVTLSETHVKESEPTENPTEEGFVVADHIDLKPDTLTIHAVVSNTPLDIGSSLSGLATSGGALIGKQIGGGLGASILGTSAGAILGLLKNSDSKALKAYQHFRDLQKKRVPFTVITGFERYENMVLTNLTVNRDAKTGQILDFTAAMKQIVVVKSKTVNIANTKGRVNGAGKKTDLGHISPEIPNNDTLSLSLFKSITGAGGK